MGNRIFVQNDEHALININMIRTIYICSVNVEDKIFGVKAITKDSKTNLFVGSRFMCDEYINEIYKKLGIRISAEDSYNNDLFEGAL